MGAVEHEVLVDLVGHGHDVTGAAQFGYLCELVAAEHLSGRVVGRVEEEQAGTGADGRGQFVGVEASGIWIESEEAANRIADRFRVKPATPSAFFIPFAQIVTILASNDSADATETGTVVIETAA